MWSANVASIAGYVVDPRDIVQVLLTAGQPLHDPALPSVDQGQPSVHTTAAAHAAASRCGQGSAAARAGPHATTATATTTATGVPGPACGSHCASSGGNGSNRFTPCGQQHPADGRGRDDEQRPRRDRGQVRAQGAAPSGGVDLVGGARHEVTLAFARRT